MRDLQELVRSSLMRCELAAPEKKGGGGVGGWWCSPVEILNLFQPCFL